MSVSQNLFILLLIDTWAISIFCLLWIKLLRIFVYKAFSGHVFSFFLEIQLRLEFLGHRYLTFHETAIFWSCYTILYSYECCDCSTTLPIFGVFSLFHFDLFCGWVVISVWAFNNFYKSSTSFHKVGAQRCLKIFVESQ